MQRDLGGTSKPPPEAGQESRSPVRRRGVLTGVLEFEKEGSPVTRGFRAGPRRWAVVYNTADLLASQVTQGIYG